MNRRLVNKWAGLALRAIDSDWRKCPKQEQGFECPGLRCSMGTHRALRYLLLISETMKASLLEDSKSLK